MEKEIIGRVKLYYTNTNPLIIHVSEPEEGQNYLKKAEEDKNCFRVEIDFSDDTGKTHKWSKDYLERIDIYKLIK